MCFPFGFFPLPYIQQMDDYCRYLVDELHVLYNSWMMMTRPLYDTKRSARSHTDVSFSFSLSLSLSLLSFEFFPKLLLYTILCSVCLFVFILHLYFKKQTKQDRKTTNYTSIWVPGSFLMCNKVKVSVCN